ncbi:hypothetical protein Ahy_Scaffold1g107349 [Arachis hypogaea]|uniref:Disease resistance protein winged helix domain-containing protein n=1 Tax=Arachis hypogaea TaxID=3818 RepID=A0A444WVE7_ARAHY|nr:hypothetical protein Ahy_Scaffold1g107349 [Arachis hypogaea]
MILFRVDIGKRMKANRDRFLQIDEERRRIIHNSPNHTHPKGNAIMGALRISYFSLDLSIRRCFSFCSIYPQDFQIVKEQLVPLWMANGLIKARGNMEVEEVGNEVWDELLAETSYLEKRFQRDLDHLNLNFTLGKDSNPFQRLS